MGTSLSQKPRRFTTQQSLRVLYIWSIIHYTQRFQIMYNDDIHSPESELKVPSECSNTCQCQSFRPNPNRLARDCDQDIRLRKNHTHLVDSTGRKLCISPKCIGIFSENAIPPEFPRIRSFDPVVAVTPLSNSSLNNLLWEWRFRSR